MLFASVSESSSLLITAGRGFRYFLEGFLAVEYGEAAKDYMHQNYPYIALGVVALIVIGALFYFFTGGAELRRTRRSPRRMPTNLLTA